MLKMWKLRMHIWSDRGFCETLMRTLTKVGENLANRASNEDKI